MRKEVTRRDKYERTDEGLLNRISCNQFPFFVWSIHSRQKTRERRRGYKTPVVVVVCLKGQEDESADGNETARAAY